MEASPPLSNAGPRKKTQSKVASEQVLAWSGLPIVTIRPTVFLEGFFVPLTAPTVRNRGRIEPPFGRGKTSPVATADVARVVAAVLAVSVRPPPSLTAGATLGIARDSFRTA
jgi:NAD(P)H dehydrogenase (quinone)